MENKKESTLIQSVKIISVLSLICVVVALLLAFVNSITKDVIKENAERESREAVLAIFPDGDKVENFDVDGREVSAVLKGSEILGYCVNSSASGFGGEIETIVGIGSDGKVCGVKIISMSETPGVGSKTKSDSFLERYIGKEGTLTVGENVDGITGATISSKAVTEAVNKALALEIDIEALLSAN